MYLLLVNGPPRSGKDTFAHLLREHMIKQPKVQAPHIEPLSAPLRRIAYEMVGMRYGDSRAMDYEVFKTTWFPKFQRSGRELMIDVSERFMKRNYGDEIFASLLWERVNNSPVNLVIISDSGFQGETNRLASLAGPSNVVVVNVLRNGCSFDNDSREWISHPWASSQHYQIPNNRTLEDLATEAGRIYGRMVNQLGWIL